MIVRRVCFLAVLVLSVAILGTAAPDDPASVRSIYIVAPDDHCKRIAEVLQERIQSYGPFNVVVSETFQGDDGLSIILHRQGLGSRPEGGFESIQSSLPSVEDEILPEGFVIKTIDTKDEPTVILSGADKRGLLYAAGELLRQLQYEPAGVRLPNLDIQSAPAYRFRGFSTNQGGTMRKITGARGWTEGEQRQLFLDYALAGANCFYTSREGGSFHDYVKQFDCMTLTDARPNQHVAEFPEAWSAGGLDRWEGTNWVCPSIPEARAAVLAQWEEDFPKRADHDIFRMYAGDPGGCRDERCAPWGNTFVHLCEEVAGIWLKHHPGTTVLIANQDLSNAGDAAIFDYLNESPRAWLSGLAYGPGSNALSSYFRDELRNDLLVYPRGGWVNRYLAETLRAIPKDQFIVHYTDLTHWISAQYAVEHPDLNVIKAYGRRTFHARPQAFYDIFQQIMPFSEGDIIYSEGYHDEFHQFLWNRLLWNPAYRLDEVMAEYCELYFGPAAAPDMAKALLLMEDNLTSPLQDNPGIDRYYIAVKTAGWMLTAEERAANYRWQLHMQKAALDKYNQLKLRQELGIEARALEIIAGRNGEKAGQTDLKEVQSILTSYVETGEMLLLREEARRLGDQTEELFGVRNGGYFKLDEPFRDLDRVATAVTQADEAKSSEERESALEKAADLIQAPTKPGNIFW